MEKKKILHIGTGGTIASEQSASGLTPELTSEQLLRYIPDISQYWSMSILRAAWRKSSCRNTEAMRSKSSARSLT